MDFILFCLALLALFYVLILLSAEDQSISNIEEWD